MLGLVVKVSTFDDIVSRGVGSRFSLGGTPVAMMYIKSICLFEGAYSNLFISPSPKTTKARFYK